MGANDWAQYCRAALVRSAARAAAQCPGPGEALPEKTHALRKTLKQARAIGRLFLGGLGEPARVTNAALAAIRRQTGRARDLDVMAVRLERLEAPAEIAQPLMAAIKLEREAARRAARGLAAGTSRARLAGILRRVEGWDVSSVGRDDVVAAVARTYRQARRRGRLAFASDDPALLHAFRARVVDLRYQLALLSCAWPEALNAQAEALNELREALGDFNDLHVLAKFAAESGVLEPEALAELRGRADAKQQKLRRRAEIESGRLFAETPRAFAARLDAYLARPVSAPAVSDDAAASQA
jgi:CHAD domain-containing protein